MIRTVAVETDQIDSSTETEILSLPGMMPLVGVSGKRTVRPVRQKSYRE